MTIKLIQKLNREVNGEKEKLISNEMNFSHGRGAYRPEGEITLGFKVGDDYGRYKVVIPPVNVPHLIESLAVAVKSFEKEMGSPRYTTLPERQAEAAAYLRVLADNIERGE